MKRMPFCRGISPYGNPTIAKLGTSDAVAFLRLQTHFGSDQIKTVSVGAPADRNVMTVHTHAGRSPYASNCD